MIKVNYKLFWIKLRVSHRTWWFGPFCKEILRHNRRGTNKYCGHVGHISEQIIEATYLKNLKKNGKLDKLKMYLRWNQNNNKARRNKSCDQESRNLSNARLLNSWKMRKVNKKFVRNVVTNQKVTSGKRLFKSIVFCVQVNWKGKKKMPVIWVKNQNQLFGNKLFEKSLVILFQNLFRLPQKMNGFDLEASSNKLGHFWGQPPELLCDLRGQNGGYFWNLLKKLRKWWVRPCLTKPYETT